MSKKNVFIASAVVVALLAGGLGYFKSDLNQGFFRFNFNSFKGSPETDSKFGSEPEAPQVGEKGVKKKCYQIPVMKSNGGWTTETVCPPDMEENPKPNTSEETPKPNTVEDTKRKKQTNDINRAEMAKLMFEELSSHVRGGIDTGADDCFSDTGGKWYGPYACYFVEKGKMAGYPDGTFRGSNPIIRAEGSKMVVEAFNIPFVTNKISFPDLITSEWYYNYVKTLVIHQIAKGYPNGQFGPSDNLQKDTAKEWVEKAGLL